MHGSSQQEDKHDDTIADVNCGGPFVPDRSCRKVKREGAISAGSHPLSLPKKSGAGISNERVKGLALTAAIDIRTRADLKFVEGAGYPAYVAFNDWVQAPGSCQTKGTDHVLSDKGVRVSHFWAGPAGSARIGVKSWCQYGYVYGYDGPGHPGIIDPCHSGCFDAMTVSVSRC